MTELQRSAAMLAGAWPGLRMHQPLRPIVLDDWPISRNAGAVADARHYIRQLATRIIGYGHADDVELMVGELLANAVEHGGETMQARVTAEWQRVRVEVHDSGTGPIQDAAVPTLTSEGGRGLYIVAALATRWGLDCDNAGTTAWFELAAR